MARPSTIKTEIKFDIVIFNRPFTWAVLTSAAVSAVSVALWLARWALRGWL
jgi:hypothetical protein